MTTEEEFEKWWAIGVSIDEAHRIAKTGQAGKECARIAYLAATQRTAQRCVEICEAWGDAKVVKWVDSALADSAKVSAWNALQCAAAIREQFLP